MVIVLLVIRDAVVISLRAQPRNSVFVRPLVTFLQASMRFFNQKPKRSYHNLATDKEQQFIYLLLLLTVIVLYTASQAVTHMLGNSYIYHQHNCSVDFIFPANKIDIVCW